MRFTNSPYEKMMQEIPRYERPGAAQGSGWLLLPWLPLLAGHRLCDLLPGVAGRRKGQGVTLWPVS